MAVHIAARDIAKLDNLIAETGAVAHSCDASNPAAVSGLFDALPQDTPLDLVVYNPSRRVRGPITEIDAEEVKAALLTTCYGAFLVGQQAARRMEIQGHGSIFFTGASAGVKGFAQSATFAMGKFGLRGLCQSMARELHPKNIHIGHFVIDGGIAPEGDENPEENRLSARSLAEHYLSFHKQDRTAWAWEIELRPWLERF
jgi:NAD(P)-dependent dehydrogenase (short-subunit alcohol dehydrogenase family)